METIVDMTFKELVWAQIVAQSAADLLQRQIDSLSREGVAGDANRWDDPITFGFDYDDEPLIQSLLARTHPVK